MRKNILFILTLFFLFPFFLQAQSQKALPLKFTIKKAEVVGERVSFDISYKSFEGDSFSGKGTLHLTLSELDSLWHKRPNNFKGMVGNGVISSLLFDLSEQVENGELQGKLGILRMKGSSAIKRKEVIWVNFTPDLSR
ncbi:MAG: hypothetical protein AAF694_11650 [Bacteroidota bacterium]